MEKERILAIVVTHNRLELLRGCIDALFKQTVTNFDILVVNNASTDGTREYLNAQNSPRFKYVNRTVNDGGAGGYHFGFSYALNNCYDYAWVMDDDTLPSFNALEELLKASSILGDYGFLASLVLFSDGSLAKMNNCLLSSRITTKTACYYQNNLYFLVKTATFVSFFVKTSTLKEYGLPIKEMFLWSDDTEFSSRISKEKPCFFIPQSIVIHRSISNYYPDLVTLKKENFWKMELNIRNRFYIARRDGFIKILRFFARHFLLIIKIFCKAKDSKLLRIWVVIKGTILGFFFFPSKKSE